MKTDRPRRETCALCQEPAAQPVMIDAIETGSGPGVIVYACPPCARAYACTPMAPQWLRESEELAGWQIKRVPTKKVRVATDGKVIVPLWLLRDRSHHADLDLVLSRAEAAALYAQLGSALEGATGAHRE